MPIFAAAALLSQAAAPPPATDAAAEVVVTARKRRCEVALADRVLKGAEFSARAAEWAAGTPVRVVVGEGASYRCLAKIVFRLQSHGVTRVRFD